MNEAIQNLLAAEGYKLVDDASEQHGRLTFLCDETADRPCLLALSHALRYAGWQAEDAVPPRYRLPGTKMMIEIEPGGAETSGHYLHLIEARD